MEWKNGGGVSLTYITWSFDFYSLFYGLLENNVSFLIFQIPSPMLDRQTASLVYTRLQGLVGLD